MPSLLEKATRPELHRGLEGVVVAESELSDIDGDRGRLVYLGYDVDDLAREATFEEVLYLLWHGHLPDEEERAAFERALANERDLPGDVLATLERLARSHEDPMAALRTAVSMLSAFDPEADAEADDLEATLRKGRRITAKIPTALAAFDRLRRNEAPIDPREDLGHADNFLYMLTGEEPDEVAAETFDRALILHVDHGLNVSTFTAMVIASTLADAYDAVTGAIGALSGPWHGGANQDVMRTLIEIHGSGQDPLKWTEETLAGGRRIPGWGHRVYSVKDPRAEILQERSKLLAESTGEWKWYNYITTIETHLTEVEGLPEKGIAPNVDFYSGSVYYQLGIPIDLYTPIFAMSRVGGWMGHALEYLEDPRLIRPRGRYVGSEDRSYVPIAER